MEKIQIKYNERGIYIRNGLCFTKLKNDLDKQLFTKVLSKRGFGIYEGFIKYCKNKLPRLKFLRKLQ